jgi:hypothetical protein
MAETQATLADLVRRFFRNTRILRNHPRLGPVAGSSPAGYQHNSDLEKNRTISEFNRLTTLVATPVASKRPTTLISKLFEEHFPIDGHSVPLQKKSLPFQQGRNKQQLVGLSLINVREPLLWTPQNDAANNQMNAFG